MSIHSAPKSPRRSLLFTPGDSFRRMKKAAGLGADVVILDLEDGVAVSQKEEARQNVATVLSEVDFGRVERFVRVNQPDSDFYAADLQAVVEIGVDGIVLPKVESSRQLQRLDQRLTTAERSEGLPAGGIRLFALIETAQGVMNLNEVSRSSGRLDGLLFGAEDLAVDLGASRSPAGWEVFYGRSAVLTAAAAYGLEAIDTVYVDYRNTAGLEEDASFAQQLGYTGKMAIHPGQVEVLNRVFSPSAAEIARAERLIQAFQSHVAAGSGVFVLDDRMVDMPHVRAAERLLERARLAGLAGE
ncbi:MAG: CoA ester lyase [Chloroflexota bacterium]|nr:MAG: CoA ester lyase [Chloroflexota bacterium]